MKLRLLSASTLVATALLLGACDMGTAQPTVTPATQTQPTTPAQENPTATTATGAPTTIAPTATTATADQPTPTQAAGSAGEPTATQPAAGDGGENDGPLTLNPVTIGTTDATRKGVFGEERSINLPPGFNISVFAQGISGVRMLEKAPNGMLYATSPGTGKVYMLPDEDKDGVADEVKTFADNLAGVHGIAFHDDAIFVATEGAIIRLQDTDGDGVADKRDVLASDLPTGGGHSTRTLAFGPDGKLYVSAGSSCNVCRETNDKRAAILRYSVDGKFEKVYASGLRNAVGILFHPITGGLWATNNGRDSLGDDIPPETIYNVKEDANYGWPFCYGDRIPDESQSPPAGFCEKTGVPAVKMQAHSAPLGLAFYNGNNFPASYQGDLFVAFHGSWNRSVPTGYKVVRVRFKDNQPDPSAGDLLVEDFATGWQANGGVWGRPVDPFMAQDGSLLLTDDQAGAIYRIYYEVKSTP
ncbi:MAG: PQQ-dependent sugar dehydrogenase [Chloroflexota bacterium]